MIHSMPTKKIKEISFFALIGILITSCGSYQQASYYDNDGIYSSSNKQVTTNNKQAVVKKTDNTYANYFGEKANEYNDILENEIFTDVDSYYSNQLNDSTDVALQTDYINQNNNYNGTAGWGENPTNVSINIHDNWGWNNAGFFNNWGWGNAGFYNNWGYGGYGWNRFYSPWRNRGFYNNWGYGYGFNYGWGGYNSFYCPPLDMDMDIEIMPIIMEDVDIADIIETHIPEPL